MVDKQMKNNYARIGEEFHCELEKIKDERMNSGIDKKRKSTRILTNMIIKHNSWPTIQRDLLRVALDRSSHGE